MNNQTSTPNRFQAINWSNYSQASQQGPIEPTFKLAFIDCEHTHEYGSDAQFWKEYSQVIEINADGDIVNSTYFVTLWFMNHETQAKLKAALVTGYIMLATMTGIAFFGRFIFALINN